jgi:hypothetical protein
MKEIKYDTQFYTVSTFVIPFYYSSGSATLLICIRIREHFWDLDQVG